MTNERNDGLLHRAGRTAPSKLARAMVGALGMLSLAALAQSPPAQPRITFPDAALERRVSMGDVLLETVRIEGQMHAWTLRKICLDGQAYWIGFSETNPTGISTSYKDGKPEPCRARAR